MGKQQYYDAMTGLTITTNNVPRLLLYGYELTEKEQQEFDYIGPDELPSHGFVRYRGVVYDVNEFMACQLNGLDQEAWSQWHGYHSDSAFSGVLIKYVEGDSDRVVMGTYYS